MDLGEGREGGVRFKTLNFAFKPKGRPIFKPSFKPTFDLTFDQGGSPSVTGNFHTKL
jgi:hypothetical protein